MAGSQEFAASLTTGRFALSVHELATGAPYLLMLFLTISIARSTPAQKPRGAANKILICLLFIFF